MVLAVSTQIWYFGAAGLVMNAFVLAAFKSLGGNPAPLKGIITSDEEIASPSSRPIIERVTRLRAAMARSSRLARNRIHARSTSSGESASAATSGRYDFVYDSMRCSGWMVMPPSSPRRR